MESTDTAAAMQWLAEPAWGGQQVEAWQQGTVVLVAVVGSIPTAAVAAADAGGLRSMPGPWPVRGELVV